MARASEGNEQLLCSFCGKSQRQVKKLIAGPGVYICDECIDLCNEIIDEELTTQLRSEAAQSVARELALEAVADRAGIQVSDDDVIELVREQAEAAGDDPEVVRQEIWAHGHQEALREDLRLRKALDRLAADVQPISAELAEAREKLWTPDKEKAEPEQKLWTPGMEET